MIPGNRLRDNTFMTPGGADATPRIEVVNQFKDKQWRLHNLYWIQNEDGKRVRFVPREVQDHFNRNLWYLNILCKGRQHGMTTDICIWILDEIFFLRDKAAGVIAHTLPDAKKIFDTKVQYPYESLPSGLRAVNPASTDSTNELKFSNGSSIFVATSGRSGTLQYVLITEFGYTCAMFPDKAEEIVTGTLNTVHEGNFVFVESTARGRNGHFYELAKRARDEAIEKKPLTKLDWKHHFYPWWMNPAYKLDDADTRMVVIDPKMEEYFQRLDLPSPEYPDGIQLTKNQKAWYIKKHAVMKDNMYREFPSTWDEAFSQSLEGAFFAAEMNKARFDGRITSVPHMDGYLVHTFWDIGLDDMMAIWFVQQVGLRYHFIHYYENCEFGFRHYFDYMADLSREKGYRYGYHFAPHDMNTRILDMDRTPKSRLENARRMGYNFIVGQQWMIEDQVNEMRNMLPTCWFDAIECERGIQCLESFRKQWNERTQTYTDNFVHDWSSHGASAAMLFAMKWDKLQGAGVRAQPVEQVRRAY